MTGIQLLRTGDLAALHARLDEAEETSSLPERATTEPALHDLLIRLRTGT